MSKIIKMYQELIERCVSEFINMLSSAKLSDGKLTFTKNFDSSDDKAVLYMTPNAYVKTLMLVGEFEKEVAWHGIAGRCEDEENAYFISDVMVYPQEVTGTTVTTDQSEYENWLMGFDDETFNSIRMQAHSHVRMGVSPSVVDLTHQESILSQLGEDDFYIFMIWNKSLNINVKIYDMKKNRLYETKDVSVEIYDEDIDYTEFMSSAKQNVKEKKYTPTASTKSSNASGVESDSKKKTKAGGSYYNGYSSYGSYYKTLLDSDSYYD